LQALNIRLFEWMGGGNTPNGALLWLASQLAGGTVWVIVALLAVAAWRCPPERRYIVAACLLSAAAAWLAHAIAAQLNHPRPFMMGLSPSWLPHGTRGSLPSTHASVMFTLALCFLWRPSLRNFGWCLAGLALLTGWARVYVGFHFPSDIAAGLLLGAALAWLLTATNHLARRLIHGSPVVVLKSARVV
jgi:undecaprenyl-diphosphatase